MASFVVSGCTSPQSEATDTDEVRARSDNAEFAELYRQDQTERRRRVQELLDADSVVTAADHFHAAMIYQHGGDSTAYRQAYDLARRSVEFDSTSGIARWLTAAAWDRYLLSKDKPQWYGTQYLILNETTYLQPIGTTRVSDAERREHGVATLAQIRARLTEANGENRGLPQVPDSVEFETRK